MAQMHFIQQLIAYSLGVTQLPREARVILSEVISTFKANDLMYVNSKGSGETVRLCRLV